METNQNSVCHQKFIHLVIYMLLLSCMTHGRLIAQGWSTPLPAEAAQEGIRKEGKVVNMVRSLIGSRPPKCDIKCDNCDHCEAIQVPVGHVVRGHRTKMRFSAFSSADDNSNYKPISWKCKCGDLIFEPRL